MIKRLRIQNFKSHKDTDLELNYLTVLSGQNGVGKSTFIQSLLLLRQTFSKNRLSEILDLNDPLCFIGKTKDALYQFSEKEDHETIFFELHDTIGKFSWLFDASKEATYLEIKDTNSENSNLESLSLFSKNFQYISSARSAEYKSDDYSVNILNQLSLKEGRGELAAQYLFKNGKTLRVLESILHKTEKDPYLLSQATAWGREICKDVNIEPENIGDTYNIKFSFDTKFGPTDLQSNKNVAFGLPYSLPVIIALLLSKEGSLILIENPEAHIHPYGLAKLAELICRAAHAHIQVIIETHSDHIINGILVQCKRNEINNKEGINKDLVTMYHFDIDEKHTTIPSQVSIDSNGRIKNRPSGFFDQIGKDLRNLI
jgi:predicted ATPase